MDNNNIENNIIHYTRRIIVCNCGRNCMLKNYIRHAEKSIFHEKYLKNNNIQDKYGIKYVIF